MYRQMPVTTRPARQHALQSLVKSSSSSVFPAVSLGFTTHCIPVQVLGETFSSSEFQTISPGFTIF